MSCAVLHLSCRNAATHSFYAQGKLCARRQVFWWHAPFSVHDVDTGGQGLHLFRSRVAPLHRDWTRLALSCVKENLAVIAFCIALELLRCLQCNRSKRAACVRLARVWRLLVAARPQILSFRSFGRGGGAAVVSIAADEFVLFCYSACWQGFVPCSQP